MSRIAPHSIADPRAIAWYRRRSLAVVCRFEHEHVHEHEDVHDYEDDHEDEKAIGPYSAASTAAGTGRFSPRSSTETNFEMPGCSMVTP